MGWLDRLANAAIVVVSVVFLVFLAQVYRSGSLNAPPPIATYERGDNLSGVLDVDFTKAERTMLLVLASSCAYCTKSMPFYRTLSTLSETRNGFQIVAVMSKADPLADEYLKVNEFQPARLLRLDPGASTFIAPPTPTLILVDRTGRVLKTWLGQLSEQGEKEVVTAVS